MSQILKKDKIPVGLLLLFAISLFIPALSVAPVSMWSTNIAYVFNQLPAGSMLVWDYYWPVLASLAYVVLLIFYFVLRKRLKVFGYLWALLFGGAALIFATPLVREPLLGGDFRNAVYIWAHVFSWGYYLSMLFALSLVVWMFLDVHANQ